MFTNKVMFIFTVIVCCAFFFAIPYSLWIILYFLFSKPKYYGIQKVYDMLIIKILQMILIIISSAYLCDRILGGLEIRSGFHWSKVLLYFLMFFWHSPIGIITSLIFIWRFRNVSEKKIWLFTTVPIIDIVTIIKIIYYEMEMVLWMS